MSIGETEVENYVKQALNPQSLGLSKVANVLVKRIDRGSYNINYLVNIDSRKFVFRFNLENYIDVENQIGYEYEILKFLERWKIAPKAHFIDITKRFFSYDLLVEEFIEGVPLHFGEKLLVDLAKLLKRLHRISVPSNHKRIKFAGSLLEQWNQVRDRLKKIDLDRFDQDFSAFLEADLSKIDHYAVGAAKLFSPEERCLNHRDLVSDNVLVADHDLRVVDWQSAMTDDPSYDLAFFLCDLAGVWNFQRFLTNEEKQTFLTGYEPSNSLVERVKVRLPMVYLELLIWVAWRTQILEDRLSQNAIPDSEIEFVKSRIRSYKNLFKEGKMKRYIIFLREVLS